MKPQVYHLRNNFLNSELWCPCCYKLPINDESNLFLDKMQKLRDLIGVIPINSGFRCMAHNIAVGGDLQSDHLQMRAFDTPIKNNAWLWKLVNTSMALGFNNFVINKPKNFLHIAITKNKEWINTIQVKV